MSHFPDALPLEDFAVYLDLDGVEADYARGMINLGYHVDPALGRELNKSGTSHPLKREMYEKIKGTDFYRHLPIQPGGVELYGAVHRANPIILTAAPRFGSSEEEVHLNPFWLGAAYHKRFWVETTLLPAVINQGLMPAPPETAFQGGGYLSSGEASYVPIPDERFICTTSQAKWTFMGRKHSDHQILIDDRVANCEAWAEAGGFAIVHASLEDTLAKLGAYVAAHA